MKDLSQCIRRREVILSQKTLSTSQSSTQLLEKKQVMDSPDSQNISYAGDRIAKLTYIETLSWGAFYVPLVITSDVSNLIVIWIILSHRSMRKVTNYFIVNLSLSDLLLTTFNVPTAFYYTTQGNWPFGSIYCKFWNFMAVASMSVSVFTLTAIAFDR